MQDILPTDNGEVSLTKIEDNFNELNNGKANISGGNTFNGNQTFTGRETITTVIDDTLPALGAGTGAKFRLLQGISTYGTLFGVLGSGKGYIQQQRVDGTATAYALQLNPNGGDLEVNGQNWTSAWTSWIPSGTYVNGTTYAKYKIIGKTAHIVTRFSVSGVPTFEFQFSGFPFTVNNSCVGLVRVRQLNTLYTASYELVGTGGYVAMHPPQNTFSGLTGTWDILFSATCEIA